MQSFSSTDAALVASAFLMGLAGSLHCMLMCGAAFGAIARHGDTAPVWRPLLSLHAGRIASYAAAGALIATGVSALGTLQAAGPLLRPIWSLVHVGAVALGLWLLWKARAPAWLSVANPRLAAVADLKVVRVVKRLPASGRAAVAGLCWAGMPCGLLQSALLVAALASGPLQGATVMVAFASASALGLGLGPHLWSRLRSAGNGERWASGSARLAGLVLAASSLFALSHGLSAAIEQALCRVTG